MHWMNLLHRLVRPFTTDRIGVYNGVAARDTAVTDSGDHYPRHKHALCTTLRNYVDSGDHVVVVGGGRGVAAVHAARQNATVTVYEAAREMVDILHETARLNQVDYEVRHAVVGTAHNVYGTPDGAARVAPGELSGDVLVLDCEGAERDILPVGGFRAVIAETHPRYGADTSDVVELLSEASVVAPDPVDGDVVVGV